MTKLVNLFRLMLSKVGIGVCRNSTLEYLKIIPHQLHEALLASSTGVIHIGAHLAEERDIYRKYGLPIIWIEGLPIFARHIKNGIRDPQVEKVYEVFLGETNESEVPFFITNNAGSSSSLFPLQKNVLSRD